MEQTPVYATANVEYSGMSDYWSGNGRRWDDDAACIFASFDQETTWRDLIAQLVDWQSDMDDKPLFEALDDAELESAIKACLRGYGYADYKADIEPCFWAKQLDADEDYSDGESPQLILLIEVSTK